MQIGSWSSKMQIGFGSWSNKIQIRAVALGTWMQISGQWPQTCSSRRDDAHSRSSRSGIDWVRSRQQQSRTSKLAATPSSSEHTGGRFLRCGLRWRLAVGHWVRSMDVFCAQQQPCVCVFVLWMNLWFVLCLCDCVCSSVCVCGCVLFAVLA